MSVRPDIKKSSKAIKFSCVNNVYYWLDCRPAELIIANSLIKKIIANTVSVDILKYLPCVYQDQQNDSAF